MCYAYGCCETDGDAHLAAEMVRYLANFAASGKETRLVCAIYI